MEIRGAAELTIAFDHADVQEIQLQERTGYRIGPLFAGESVAQELLGRTGRPTRVAVRLRAREVNGRTYLSAVITDVLDIPSATSPTLKPKAAKPVRNGQPKARTPSLAKRLAE